MANKGVHCDNEKQVIGDVQTKPIQLFPLYRRESGERKTPVMEYIQSVVSAESIIRSIDEHEGRAIVLHDEADFLNVLTRKSNQE